MLKKIPQIRVNRFYFILIISTIFMVIYNFPVALIKIELDKKFITDGFISLLISEFLLGILLLVIFFLTISFSKFLLRGILYLLMLLSAVVSFFVWELNIFIEEILMGTVFETNFDEVVGVFHFLLIPWVLLFAVIPITFIQKKVILSSFISIKTFIKSFFVTVAFLILTYIVIIALNPSVSKNYKPYGHVINNAISYYVPFNYIRGTSNYIFSLSERNLYKVDDISLKYPFSMDTSKFKDEQITIILVIGESARADHQSLNGYYRETNPNLKKINNLINFPNVYSCSTLSRLSVNCILSHQSRNEFSFPVKNSNLISAFNSLGFETYFYTTQKIYDNGVSFFHLASKDAKNILFHSSIRAYLPPATDKILDEYLTIPLKKVIESNHKRKLVVLYLTGSHIPYTFRYSEKFDVFKGNPNIKDDILKAQYDNTILYTDYALSQIIKTASKGNTFLYYVADHGESLGENGRYIHGILPYENAPKEQINVPQFIWATDSMIKLMGEDYNNIIKKKNNKLSHDNVFHTLFDCFGITSDIVDKKLSLCK
jgi:lipid A ethanolaminephosphotransferase